MTLYCVACNITCDTMTFNIISSRIRRLLRVIFDTCNNIVTCNIRHMQYACPKYYSLQNTRLPSCITPIANRMIAAVHYATPPDRPCIMQCRRPRQPSGQWLAIAVRPMVPSRWVPGRCCPLRVRSGHRTNRAPL